MNTRCSSWLLCCLLSACRWWAVLSELSLEDAAQCCWEGWLGACGVRLPWTPACVDMTQVPLQRATSVSPSDPEGAVCQRAPDDPQVQLSCDAPQFCRAVDSPHAANCRESCSAPTLWCGVFWPLLVML